MSDHPKTVEEILALKQVPVVSIDQDGLFVFVSPEFEKTYGWSEKDLLGKSVTTIMPPSFRNAHTVGFSRFLATEEPKVAGKPLPLAVLFKDGKTHDAEHFILGEKKDGKWRFAATITLR